MMKTYKILFSFFLILMSVFGFSQSVPSYVPTNGLVGWWGFNGNAQDGSGNGNHGSINGTTLTTDRFGNLNAAYYFNGSNNYIQIPNSATLNPNYITISGWINIAGYAFNEQYGARAIITKWHQLSNCGGLGDSYNFQLSAINSQNVLAFSTNANSQLVNSVNSSNYSINLNNWYHFAVINSPTGQYIYINGSLVASISGSLVICPTTNDLYIGADNFQGTLWRHFNGKIDDIGIWNRALTQQEITNLYNSQLPTQTSLCLPTITTSSPSSVGVDTVVIGGNISNDGGSSIVLRGVCYSTSPNPNMGNSRTVDGSGVGSFNTVLRGLASSTMYYARSYAKNSNGVVVYGNEVSFITPLPAPQPCPSTPTVTDIDGNIYNTVQIGNQCWTQSNLKVSKYRNGDTIPTGLSNSAWETTTSGAYAIYNNDPVNDGLYGKLYNHYAVTDSRGLCPTGWHVPSDAEWTILENQLGGSSVAGGALKSIVTQPTASGWNPPNTGATNSSGFTALPGGLSDFGGTIYNVTIGGFWWSSSVTSGSDAGYYNVYYNNNNLNHFIVTRTYGFSVRCLKNTLPQVNTTSVTNVTPSTAQVTGEVISDGSDQNTTRGFCYSTTSNPTLSNDTTMNGTGIGAYSDTLQNLTPLTTYYVRAYVTNSVGTAYGNEVSFTTGSLSIGSNYAGGIVFYLDSSGQHGLVCAPSNQGGFTWGVAFIGGTSSAFGTGQANTSLILAGSNQRPIAASVCDDLVLNGYSDWYLPSFGELHLMYLNLRVQFIGGFLNAWYWSSSQGPTGWNNHAWVMDFGFGNIYHNIQKVQHCEVRAVRAF